MVQSLGQLQMKEKKRGFVPSNIQQQFASMAQPTGAFTAGISKPLPKAAQATTATSALGPNLQNNLMDFLFPQGKKTPAAQPSLAGLPSSAFTMGGTPSGQFDPQSIASLLAPPVIPQSTETLMGMASGPFQLGPTPGDPTAAITPDMTQFAVGATPGETAINEALNNFLTGSFKVDPTGTVTAGDQTGDETGDETGDGGTGDSGDFAGDEETENIENIASPDPDAEVIQKNLGLPPIERFLPSAEEMAGMQQRAFTGALTSQDLSRLFEAETQLSTIMGQLQQSALNTQQELQDLQLGKDEFGYQAPPKKPIGVQIRRMRLVEQGLPDAEALTKATAEHATAQAAYEQELANYNALRSPERIAELRRLSTQSGLINAYEMKRDNLISLRERLVGRNAARREELPLEAERAQALQGLFRQLFPGAAEGAFAPLGQVSRLSVPGIIPMLAEAQQRRQVGSLGETLSRALGSPEELAGIGQAVGYQPNLLGDLLQQVLGRGGTSGTQRPTLQYR